MTRSGAVLTTWLRPQIVQRQEENREGWTATPSYRWQGRVRSEHFELELAKEAHPAPYRPLKTDRESPKGQQEIRSRVGKSNLAVNVAVAKQTKLLRTTTTVFGRLVD